MNGRTSNALAALLLANAGLLAWASCFGALYAVLSLGCAAGLVATDWFGINAVSVLLAIVWVAHLAPLAWLFAYLVRHPVRTDDASRIYGFHRRLTMLLILIGLVGIVWIGLPMLLPPCASHAY